MTIPTNLSSIVNFLRQQKMQVELQEETNQALLQYQFANKSYPLFIKSVAQGALIQCALIFQDDFKESQKKELARLLHQINKELDFPGFCMDEKGKIVFYRAVIPTPNKRVDEKLLRQILHMMEQILNLFASLIQTIAHTDALLDDINTKE
jgi:hypothetical protein